MARPPWRSPMRECAPSSAEPNPSRLRRRLMLEVAALNVAIGPVPIVRDASLALAEGQMCGLIGRNGAGKTTFLRALMGALPASGKAVLGDVDLLALPPHRRVAHG